MRRIKEYRKGRNKTVNVLLFEITYFFLFAYAFFGHVPFLTDILRILADVSLILVIFLFFCHNRMEMKSILLKVVPLLLLSSIFIFTSNSFIPFKTMLLVLASYGVDFDERIKFDLKMRCAFIVILILLSQIGLVSSAVHVFKDGSNTIKYDLGFSSPNTLGMSVFIMCLEMVYLARNKSKNLLVLIISMAIMFLVNIFTGSRTAVIAYAVFVILAFLYKYRKRIFGNKFVKMAIILSPVIVTAAMVLLYFFLSNDFSARQFVDQYTSGRFTNARLFVDQFPISIFGSDISVVGYTCDVSVVYILYSFGIFGALIYTVAFIKLLSYLYKNNIFLALVFLSFIVYGIGEKLWLYSDYNIFMTAFSLILGMGVVKKNGDLKNV